ncbi:hypothetical protein JOM56_007687 [Amanita muscaria]
MVATWFHHHRPTSCPSPLAGDRFSSRLYAAYSSWHAIGILASIRVSFIGSRSVKTSELLVASVSSKLSHLCMYRLSSPNSTLLRERLCWVTRNCTVDVKRDGQEDYPL